MVINGAIVSDLDMMFIESVLQEETSLCMMMRSARMGKHFQLSLFSLIVTNFCRASRSGWNIEKRH